MTRSPSFPTFHPLTKLLFVLFCILLFAFHPHGSLFSLFLFCLTGCVLFFSGATPGMFLKRIRHLKVLLFFVALLPFLQLGKPGFSQACDAILRISGLLSSSMLFFFIVSQEEMLDVFDQLARPFRTLHLNPRGFLISLLIGLRFIPLVFEEIERIRMSQIARGTAFHSGKFSLYHETRIFMALLIPVLTMAIRKAETLALTLHLRAFRLDRPRSAFQEYPFSLIDIGVLLFMAISIILTFFRL